MICQLAVGGTFKRNLVEVALMMEQCCWNEVLGKSFEFIEILDLLSFENFDDWRASILK